MQGGVCGGGRVFDFKLFRMRDQTLEWSKYTMTNPRASRTAREHEHLAVSVRSDRVKAGQTGNLACKGEGRASLEANLS